MTIGTPVFQAAQVVVGACAAIGPRVFLAQAGGYIAYRRHAGAGANTGRDGPGLDVALVGGRVAEQDPIAGVLIVVLIATVVVGAFIADVVTGGADAIGATIVFCAWIIVVTQPLFLFQEDTPFDWVADVFGTGVCVVAIKNDLGTADPADTAAQRAVQFHVAGRSKWVELHSALTRLAVAETFSAVVGEVGTLFILSACRDRRNVWADLFVDDRFASGATHSTA